MCIRDRDVLAVFVLCDDAGHLAVLMHQLDGGGVEAVSYTHLDVYKRQVPIDAGIILIRINLVNINSFLNGVLNQHRFLRRDLSRVLSATCNRFAYTYNRQGFLCKFSLLTLLMIATEPIPVSYTHLGDAPALAAKDHLCIVDFLRKMRQQTGHFLLRDLDVYKRQVSGIISGWASVTCPAKICTP